MTLAASVAGSTQFVEFRSVAEGVRFVITVSRNGQPVSGLNAADFVVRDNGVPQDISVAAMHDTPVDLVVVLPPLASLDQSKASLVRAYLKYFDDHLPRPGDRVAVVLAATGPQVLFRLASSALKGTSEDALTGTKHAASLDAALIGLDLLGKHAALERSNVLILLVDSSPDQSWSDESSVLALAEEKQAAVLVCALDSLAVNALVLSTGAAGSTISYGMTATSAPDLPLRLRRLAAKTGGRLVDLRPSGQRELLDQLIAEVRSRYLITYAPKPIAHDGWHDVVVELKPPNRGVIRARPGYWAKTSRS